LRLVWADPHDRGMVMPASTMGEAAAEIRGTRAQLREGDEPVELPDARRATSPWSRVRTSGVHHGPSRGFFPGQRLADSLSSTLAIETRRISSERMRR
jgi:hypothetical protein